MKKLEQKALAHVLAVLDGIKAHYHVVDAEGNVYTTMPPAEDKPERKRREPRKHLYAHVLDNIQVGELVTVPATTEVEPSHLQSICCAWMVSRFGKGSALSTCNPDGTVDIMRVK